MQQDYKYAGILYWRVEYCTVLFGKVNDALALASDWFKANKLTLHPSKTKYIFF